MELFNVVTVEEAKKVINELLFMQSLYLEKQG